MSKNEYSKGLDELQLELAGWRTRKSKAGRVPERFWSAACQLAAQSSIESVAVATGLSIKGLRKRASRSTSVSSPGASAFVELLLPHRRADLSCTIKVESAAGARMQCEVGNLDAAGLATVLREFSR